MVTAGRNTHFYALRHGPNKRLRIVVAEMQPDIFDFGLPFSGFHGVFKTKLPLDEPPDVFNGVEIRRVRGPTDNLNFMVRHPGLGELRRVGRRIVLLECVSIRGKDIDGFQMLIKDGAVNFGVHIVAKQRECRSSPNRDRAPHVNLLRILRHSLESLPGFVGPKGRLVCMLLEFGLIGEDDGVPIGVLVFQTPGQSRSLLFNG